MAVLQPYRFEVSLHSGLAELAFGEALLADGARSEAHAALQRAVVQLEGSLGPGSPHLKQAQAHCNVPSNSPDAVLNIYGRGCRLFLAFCDL